MELEIYNVLNTNKELITLLGGSNIFTIFAGKYTGSALICKWTDNKHNLINKATLSIDIYSSSYEKLINIKEFLYKILLQDQRFNFIQLNNYWVNIMLGGNSDSLWDQTVEQFTLTLNFIVTWRDI